MLNRRPGFYTARRLFSCIETRLHAARKIAACYNPILHFLRRVWKAFIFSGSLEVLVWSVDLSRKGLLGLCLIVALPLSFAARAQESYLTNGERARWAEISHRLETNPLNKSVSREGDRALKELSEAHDIRGPLCGSFYQGFIGSSYKYRREITRQFVLASGAYQIENPDRADDSMAMNAAALESVLKVYRILLQQRPGSGWKPLDDLLAMENQGRLQEAVRLQCDRIQDSLPDGAH
jgi:hypothetical protein